MVEDVPEGSEEVVIVVDNSEGFVLDAVVAEVVSVSEETIVLVEELIIVDVVI